MFPYSCAVVDNILTDLLTWRDVWSLDSWASCSIWLWSKR